MTKQDDLIDFVNDLKNINKAVEGSMDKRNKVLNEPNTEPKTPQPKIKSFIGGQDLPDKITIPKPNTELKDSLEAILQKLLTEHLDRNPNIPFYFGDTKKALEQLITQEKKKSFELGLTMGKTDQTLKKLSQS